MKKSMNIVWVAFMIAVAGGCTNQSGPSAEPTVQITSELSTRSARLLTAKNSDGSIHNTVDSLEVAQVRVLVSRMRLQRANEDTVSGDKILWTEPAVITAASTVPTTQIPPAVAVPAGLYDNVKFEFHRFSGNDVTRLQNDAVLRDFVVPDRATYIIVGRTFVRGQATPFTFRGDAVANLTLQLNPAVNLAMNTTNLFVLQIDVPALFRTSSGSMLDPNNVRNRNDIDNAFRRAIRALQR
jgi:hypothetical protein